MNLTTLESCQLHESGLKKYLSFCNWLIELNMMSSRFMCAVTVSEFPSFFKQIMFHHMYRPHFAPHSSTDGHLGGSYLLSPVTVFLWMCSAFSVSGCVPRSGITGSRGSSVFNLWNCYCVFHGGYAVFHAHQQCLSIPIYPRLYQQLFFFYFPFFLFLFMVAILMGVMWYLTVDLIYISLMINDVEYLFKNTSF